MKELTPQQRLFAQAYTDNSKDSKTLGTANASAKKVFPHLKSIESKGSNLLKNTKVKSLIAEILTDLIPLSDRAQYLKDCVSGKAKKITRSYDSEGNLISTQESNMDGLKAIHLISTLDGSLNRQAEVDKTEISVMAQFMREHAKKLLKD